MAVSTMSDTGLSRVGASSALPTWRLGALLWLVAFVPRAVTALAAFPHQDERLWLRRSEHYVRALLELDLSSATSSTSGRPTMPGITTVVVGGLTRVLWGGLRDLGVASYPGEGFSSSRSALIIAQLLMAAAMSGLLVLLWWVLTTWATRVVATTAVLILATEPVLVADGTKLTTDSFLTFFGAIGAFALAAALEIPAKRGLAPRRRHLLAVAAGVGVGGALGSKLTALTFGPFLLGLVVYAAVRAWRRREGIRDVVLVTGLTVGVAVVLLAVFWPAAWADPSGQLDVLRGTAGLGSKGHIQFFLGEITESPSPLFYFVVVPMRLTPWLFLLAIPAAFVSLRVRALRGFAVVALAYAAVPWVTILLTEKKFERYAFPIWPVLAVLVGLLVERIATWCREQGPRRWRAFEVAAAGAIAGLVVYTLLVVPYGSAYANPMLGGGPVADEVMLLGVDTAPEAGAFIRDREGDRCNDRRIFGKFDSHLWYPCGDLVSSSKDLRKGDYIVLITNSTKRDSEEQVQELRDRGRRIAVIRNRGVDIAEIIQVT